MTMLPDVDLNQKTREGPRNHRHVPETPEPLSTEPPDHSSAQAAVSSSSHRERDDDYRGVLAILNERWRVIVCRDGIQWILQRRVAPHRWSGQIFCRTKSGLLLYVKERCGVIDGVAAIVLAGLPDRIA